MTVNLETSVVNDSYKNNNIAKTHGTPYKIFTQTFVIQSFMT